MKQISSLSFLIIILLMLNFSCEKPDSTDLLPKLTTTEVSQITEASAQSGGSIDSDSGHEISVCGVCWSTNPNPTIADSITQDSTILGVFISKVSGLTPNTTYYLRAYATNKNGTAYGLEETFTTKSLGLATKEITEITVNSAQSGGFIDVDGDNSNILARGVCWNTEPNPTTQNNKTLDGEGIGEFSSALNELLINTTYYVRSYVTNSGGTYYGNEESFITRNGEISVTTESVTSITDNSAISGGNIFDDGGATITHRGVCWATSTNPTVADNQTSDGNDIGSFISTITGLAPGTKYYVRAYATNSVGTAYGNEESFMSNFTYGEVTSRITGKIWLDRNLGALRVATSSTDALSYGDLYQWGRATDGHEKRTSGTTTTLSTSNTSGHGHFIASGSGTYDWRSPQNINLWQGVNGVNNPCPTGYRLPTEAEWNAERLSWNANSSDGAFASQLKLTMAGRRFNHDGALIDMVGFYGSYWSSTVDGDSSRFLFFMNGNAVVNNFNRAFGFSVRCIKD